MMTKRQLNLHEFFADHPVFTLSQLARARGDGQDLGPARNQLKHHLRQGRILSVAREIFAVVPPG
ncbi:MAG: transcriptional regulator, partial [Thermoanaerobaculia bacterium]